MSVTLAPAPLLAGAMTAPDLATLPVMIEESYSINNVVSLGDDVTGAWWKWTPSAAGVVSFDAFLTTMPDATQPPSLLAIPFVGDASVGLDPSFTLILNDTLDGRYRLIFEVPEAAVGVPVGIGAYGANTDDFTAPILIGVRLSAIGVMPDGWTETTPSTVVVRPPGQQSGTQDGHITPDYTVAYGSVLADLTWAARCYKITNTDIADEVDCAWSLGRRSYQGTLSHTVNLSGVAVAHVLVNAAGSCPSIASPNDVAAWADPGNLGGYWGGVSSGFGPLSGMYVVNFLAHDPAADTSTSDPIYAGASAFGNYRSLTLAVTQAESASVTSWGVDDSTEAPPTGFIRLYDTNSGPANQLYTPNATPRLVGLQVAPDEVTTQGSDATWHLGNTKWFVQDTSDSYDNAWGIHWLDPATVSDGNLPRVKFGDGGNDGPGDMGTIATELATYAGGAAGSYVTVDDALIEAARAYELDLIAHHSGFSHKRGLIFTNVAAACELTGPPVTLSHSDVVATANFGRSDQVLAFSMTFAQRYMDVEMPELFPPVPTEIDADFDFTRCLFT